MTPFGPLTTEDLIEKFRALAPPGLTENMDNTFTLDEFDPTYMAAVRQVKEYGKFRGGTAMDPVPTDDDTYEIANVSLEMPARELDEIRLSFCVFWFIK